MTRRLPLAGGVLTKVGRMLVSNISLANAELGICRELRDLQEVKYAERGPSLTDTLLVFSEHGFLLRFEPHSQVRDAGRTVAPCSKRIHCAIYQLSWIAYWTFIYESNS